ncbi:hypothetical protein PsorP6_003330 [Peronosclerospora sorghi]|uniref:Uncharacterized protein n=1 Tax=Peronosclerospora sorghi TaxID=230839 RepID=A0ACC0VJG1_9STRA|nr:hypothetical protein PsorP6_003330 [Peronosclerospora sorghi]
MTSEDEEFTYSPGELDDEDDENDMDWEDVDTSQVVPNRSLSQTSGTSTSELDNLNENSTESSSSVHQIDWDQVNQSLAEDNAASNPRKRRRPAIRLTKEEKQREKTLHQAHLLLQLATRAKWMQLSRSNMLRGLLMSLTATSDVDFFAEVKKHPLPYSLSLLVRWFNREFQITAEKQLPLNRELITESSLVDVFFARKGRDYELALLFAALCGAIKLRYRLTCALDPLLVQNGKTFEASYTQKPNKRRRSRNSDSFLQKKLLVGDDEIEEVDSELDPENPEIIDRVFWLWCESLDEKSNSWIHVDVVRRLVDRPQEVEPLRGKAARFSYVVSFQDDGLLIDVTSRYTLQWSKSLVVRIADSWLKQTLEKLNKDTIDMRRQHAEGALTLLTNANMDEVLEQEQNKLEALKVAEGMPNSVEGFRKHHLYCLEQHLGQLECLHPREVVGVFNGQFVFLREHVQPLQSAFRWRRLGRDVKEDERQRPVKWLSRRSFGPGDTGGSNDAFLCTESETGNSSLALYGLWQTTEVKPSPVVDNRVPKNKYGNIEIWSPAHVPHGAVHLQLPRIERIAESLGIDFAPAVVGFEVRHGRTRPKMAGIVVAQSYEAMLLDAHAEKQHHVIEKAIASNQKLVLKRWEKLTKRLLLRQRLEDDYGVV